MTDYAQATPQRRAKAGEFYRPRHVDRATDAVADRILQAAEFLKDRFRINDDMIAACNAFERYHLASSRGSIRMASMEGRTGLGTPASQQADNGNYCPETARRNAGLMAYRYAEVLGYPASSILVEIIEGETAMDGLGRKYAYHLNSRDARRAAIQRQLTRGLQRLVEYRGLPRPKDDRQMGARHR